jgi:DNA replicative helicase MCM subunit Mcm2 (Cdc46/Mcm family)
MNGMTTQERLNDICSLSGLSEDIVRRVIDAERQSLVKSLKRGERATMIGRCVIRPEIRSKLVAGEDGPVRRTYIKLNSSVAASMEALLKEMSDFEISDEPEEVNVEALGLRTAQIAALL